MDEVVVDDSYVFRGFLAWCLWGWIPIQTGAKIKSSLFSNCKVNASYGRRTSSRQALKSVQHAAKKPVVGPDAKHEEQTACPPDESTNMLQMALELFKADFAEKELQKRSYLEALIVRDKLAALIRKSNRLTEKHNRAKKGTAASAEMKLLLDKYDDEIEELEQQLQNIQKAEMKRRQTAAAGTNSDSPPSADKDEMASFPSTTIVIEDIALVSDVVATKPTSSNNLCIECNVTPSTHKCRKCNEVICDLCCSSKRNLEMVWWCGRCFENESLTNQRQIREGKYESDDFFSGNED